VATAISPAGREVICAWTRPDRAEGDAGGVADQRQRNRLHRLEADADEQRRRKGNRCAEAGCALHEQSEEPCDEDGLSAAVGGDAGKGAAHALEGPGPRQEFVDRERGKHDPQDDRRGVRGLQERTQRRLRLAPTPALAVRSKKRRESTNARSAPAPPATKAGTRRTAIANATRPRGAAESRIAMTPSPPTFGARTPMSARSEAAKP
jgi:hypothetical protein